MFSFNYVASAQRATSVKRSVVCNFTSPDTLNLLVAKHNIIEIFQLADEGLHKLKDIVLFGHILDVFVLSEADRRTNSLLVITYPYHASILSYEADLVDTKQFIDLRDPNIKELDYQPLFGFDRLQRVVVLHIYAGHFKVIQFYPNKASIKKVYFTKCEDDKVLDIAVLGENSSLKLAVLYEKELRKYIKVYNIPQDTSNLIETTWGFYGSDGVPLKLLSLGDNLLVLTTMSAQLYLSDCNTPESSVHNSFNAITAAALVDRFRVLISNFEGELFLVTINGSQLDTTRLGNTTCASTISYLDSNCCYLGSRFGDSEMIRIFDHAEDGAYFETLQYFPNIGPIFDMVHFQLESRSNSSLITCSGAKVGGGLRYIRKGIIVDIVAQVEIGKVVDVWGLMSASRYYERLVVGYMQETRVLRLVNDNLIAEATGALERGQFTLSVGNCSDFIVQVTQEAVLVLGTEDLALYKRYTPQDFEARSFSLGKVGPSHCIVVADSSRLITIDIAKDATNCLELHDDIACIEINNCMIAYSLWSDKSLHIIRVDDFSKVWSDRLDTGVVPRSLLLTSLEDRDLLLCGLGDGKLVVFYLDSQSKTVLHIGSQALYMKPLNLNSTNYVFVACENPVVLYSYQKTVFSTPVNITSASFVAPFYMEDTPGCIAVVSDEQLQLMTIEDVQKLSIIQIQVGHTVRRLILVGSHIVAVAGSVEQQNSLNLYSQTDFSLLHSFALGEAERCIALSELSSMFVTSCVELGLSEHDETPFLRVFHISNDTIELVSQTRVETHVFSMKRLSGNLLVCGAKRRILIFELEEGRLVERHKLNWYSNLICLDTFENYVLTGDILKSITLFRWTGTVLEQVAKDYNLRYVTDIKLINAEYCYAADHFCNLYCLRVDGRKLKIVSCIGLHDMINCIRIGSLTSLNRTYDQCLFGTVSGSIGAIISISEDLYCLLNELQTLLVKTSPSIGSLKHINFRKVKTESLDLDPMNFIDGDLVETFLNLSPAERKALCLQFTRAIDVEEIETELLTLQRQH